jgi:hypothetical protein
MAYFLFNVSKPVSAEMAAAREQVAVRMRMKLWPVDVDETHRDRLRTGDLVLLYLGEPDRKFVGRVRLGSAVRRWTSSEARALPGDSPSGVTLLEVEAWDHGVRLRDAVRRIDPAGTNPYVQANARAGFRNKVVQISAGEYEAVVALRADLLVRGVPGP